MACQCRVVYDPETDAMHGIAGLPARGKLAVHLRYIVERRPRAPSAGVALLRASVAAPVADPVIVGMHCAV
eukprot:1136336-Pelagomonas_calceolata.AAC.5